MQDIESKALETYQKNINYFTATHPDVFTLLNRLEESIENASYIEKYDLEYSEDYFDVKKKTTGEFLYASHSTKISQELVSSINYKKDSGIFEGFPLYKVSKERQKTLDDRSEGYEDIFPIMNYYIDNTDNTKGMKEIEKFIFIGVGLGLHLPYLHNKIKAKEYFIIEDDVELFKLSLFTIAYYELAEESSLTFSIKDNENIFLKKMKDFLRGTFFNNRYLKYLYFPAHSNNKIKQIKNALSTQGFAFFPYKQELKKYLRPLEYINDNYKVLDLRKHLKSEIVKNKPVLLLAAGPSFKKNIAWVKENQDKFVIVAISAVLNTLYENDIKPDVVTHIDGYEGSWPLFEGIPTKTFLKDTVVIFGPFALSRLRTLFTKEQLFYHESNSRYFENLGSLSAPCVGSHSLLLSLSFNPSELYLLGLDLAINQLTGSTHSEDYEDKKQIDLKKKDELSERIVSTEDLFPVQGNLTKTVYSTAITHSSVQFLHQNIDNIKQDYQKVYNLNDGAKIFNTIPTKIDEVDVKKYASINKIELYTQFHTVLKNNSQVSLTQANIESLKGRLAKAYLVRSDIESYMKTVSYANVNNYLYDLLGVVSTILHRGEKEIDNIIDVYYTYFEYVLPLIIDFFNTQGLKNSKRHMKKFDKLLVQGMINIHKIYIETVEVFLKERC